MFDVEPDHSVIDALRVKVVDDSGYDAFRTSVSRALRAHKDVDIDVSHFGSITEKSFKLFGVCLVRLRDTFCDMRSVAVATLPSLDDSKVIAVVN